MKALPQTNYKVPSSPPNVTTPKGLAAYLRQQKVPRQKFNAGRLKQPPKMLPSP